jgi:hypothetical protein
VKSAVRAPTTTNEPMPWKARVALILWVFAGWSWLIFNVPWRAFCFFEDQRGHRKYGDAYGLAGDAHAVFGREAFAIENVSVLTGMTPDELKARGYCATAWTDEEQVFLHNRWFWKGTTALGWLSVTIAGKAITGLYSMELRAQECELLSDSVCTRVDRLRLRERRQSPLASDDWAPILPGQCVLGQAAAPEPSVVGRYTVDLPAGRDVTVMAYALPATLFVEPHLFHGGAEIAQAPGERVVFRTTEAGTHLLTLTTTADSDFRAANGRYTLQVYWGRAVGKRCPIPDFDGVDCYRATKAQGGP